MINPPEKYRLTILVPNSVVREARRNELPLGQFVSFLLDHLSENREFITIGAKLKKSLTPVIHGVRHPKCLISETQTNVA